MAHSPIAIRARLPRLEMRAIGQADPAPLRPIAHPHRPQPDDTRRDPQRPDIQGPTRMTRIGAQQLHGPVRSFRLAALRQEGDVDDLTGANLLGAGGNHNQAVSLGQGRQQVR
jgi:hypothetical protein